MAIRSTKNYFLQNVKTLQIRNCYYVNIINNNIRTIKQLLIFLGISFGLECLTFVYITVVSFST